MANTQRHIVGGGLGTFRKQAQAQREADAKAAAQAQRKEAMAKLVKAVR